MFWPKLGYFECTLTLPNIAVVNRIFENRLAGLCNSFVNVTPWRKFSLPRFCDSPITETTNILSPFRILEILKCVFIVFVIYIVLYSFNLHFILF